MKKIGLYLDSVVTGGTFQYNLSILDAVCSIPNNKFETVIAYSSDLWKNHLQKENIPAIKIERTIFSRSWFQLRYPLSLWRKTSTYFDSFTKSFLEAECDLWIFPSQDIWSYSLPVPALATVHDLMHRYERQFTESASKKEFKTRELHYSRMGKYAEGILVDSKLGKQQLIESYNVDGSKIHILPFVAPKYIYDTTNINSIDYNLPPKYFFYPAQFWEHKNHKAIVRAVAKIIKMTPDLKVVFVGSPNNGYDSLRDLINVTNLKNVFIFLDQVPDEQMQGLYSNARSLIMPTFFGPTNIPPLEAFACGCPVAISNAYGMPEQVGDAGLFFDPHSVPELAEILYKLWTDDNLISTLKDKGRQKSETWGPQDFNAELMKIVIVITENK